MSDEERLRVLSDPAFQRLCNISVMTMEELQEQARNGRYWCPASFNEASFWENALKPFSPALDAEAKKRGRK